MNISSDHYNAEWTIDELLSKVLKEIHIFEAGQHSGHSHSSAQGLTIPITASFYTGTHKTPQNRDKPKRDPVCSFCKGMHKTSLCTTVTTPKERLTIVKSAGLCFNCLAWLKVSLCTSKFTCHECHKKYYTTLCHAFTTNIMPCQTNQSQTEQLSASIDSTSAPTNTLTSTNSPGTSTNLNTTATSSLTIMTPLPLSSLYTSICVFSKLPLRTYQQVQPLLRVIFYSMKGPNVHLLPSS